MSDGLAGAVVPVARRSGSGGQFGEGPHREGAEALDRRRSSREPGAARRQGAEVREVLDDVDAGIQQQRVRGALARRTPCRRCSASRCRRAPRPASISHRAPASVRNGAPVPYSGVPKCRSQPVCSSTAAPRTSRSASVSGRMPRSAASAEVEHLGGQADESVEVEPCEVRALRVAVERAVEVGAGVADHRDDVDRELGARRVLRPGVLAGEVRRDRRRGEPGVGHQARADRVAEVDDAGRCARRGTSTSAAAAVRLLDDLDPAELHRLDEGESRDGGRAAARAPAPRCRRRARRAGSPSPVRAPAVREADGEVEVGAVLRGIGHRRQPRSCGSPPRAGWRTWPFGGAIRPFRADAQRISSGASQRASGCGRTNRYPRASSNPPIASPSAEVAEQLVAHAEAPGRGIRRRFAPQCLDVVRNRDRGDHPVAAGSGAGGAASAHDTMMRSDSSPLLIAVIHRPVLVDRYSVTRAPSTRRLKWALRATSGSKVHEMWPTSRARAHSRWCCLSARPMPWPCRSGMHAGDVRVHRARGRGPRRKRRMPRPSGRPRTGRRRSCRSARARASRRAASCRGRRPRPRKHVDAANTLPPTVCERADARPPAVSRRRPRHDATISPGRTAQGIDRSGARPGAPIA